MYWHSQWRNAAVLQGYIQENIIYNILAFSHTNSSLQLQMYEKHFASRNTTFKLLAKN